MNIHMLAHIILMPLAVVLTVMSIILMRNRKKNGLTVHRNLALAGFLCGILAFGFVFALKIKSGYPHFQSPHAIAGAITLVLLLTAGIGGALAFKKKNLHPFHKISGKIAMAVMVLTMVMGIARLVLMLK